jgi:serine/threonine protein kinase
VLTPDKYSQLLSDHPEFNYAILMPWIEGKAWGNYIVGRIQLSHQESLRLANSLINVMVELEARNIAHCDLSGGNFIFSAELQHLELIDIEDMYGPELIPLNPLPAGTSGYSPNWVRKDGMWNANADRFAVGILISEILGWQFEDVREISSKGESFFADGEFGNDSKRYNLLKLRLGQIHPELSHLFQKTWQSNNADDCPKVFEWKKVLNDISEQPISVNWGWESLDLFADVKTSENRNYQDVKSVKDLPELDARKISLTKEKIESLICPSCGKNIQADWVNCPFCTFNLIQAKVNSLDSSPKISSGIGHVPSLDEDVIAKPWSDLGQKNNSRQSFLTRIFAVFVVLGVAIFFSTVLFGDAITQISNELRKSSGLILPNGISNAFLTLSVGIVYAWIFGKNLRKSKIALFILGSALGGFVGGAIVGWLTNLYYITDPITAGAIIGFISGSTSSLIQNYFMLSQNKRLLWYIYNSINWLAIWTIGTTISWSSQSPIAQGAAAAFIIISNGGMLSLFLRNNPDIEF